MANKKTKLGHGGNRKIGRNKVKSEQYKQEKRREKNKVRKLTKYLKQHPNNLQAVAKLEEYKVIAGL